MKIKKTNEYWGDSKNKSISIDEESITKMNEIISDLLKKGVEPKNIIEQVKYSVNKLSAIKVSGDGYW